MFFMYELSVFLISVAHALIGKTLGKGFLLAFEFEYPELARTFCCLASTIHFASLASFALITVIICYRIIILYEEKDRKLKENS